MSDTEFTALETRRIKLLDGLLPYRQINLPKDNTPPRLPGDAVGRETPVSANLAVKTLQTPQYSGAVFSSSHKHHNAFSKPPPYRLYFFSPHALNNSTTPTGSNLGHTHRYSTTTLFIRDGIGLATEQSMSFGVGNVISTMRTKPTPMGHVTRTP